ncbi:MULTISPECIES: DUF2062 domain-containing protein [unclassified Novosphingobium]|uniref:DUF2062 domain-containing protein n=1 Tax=unclassified Novosphingobium TaxID=2644732 RepID=UPI00146AAE83|nr:MULTISPECIES: DUF2062 domain-containing protein [unclassified Novosphingobium]NMN03469.1 hypothetical protein [Novosphingobium sp. SG919]NMN86541.1 hypothetical protein [Novosphingobium sp. SG916]
MHQKIATMVRSSMPTREQMERNRFTGPLAARAELWRFTRRSVPRGVAIGLLVGIFAMIPGVQIAGAAAMCLPFRGNIPIAAGMTFLSNPATTPLFIAASLALGNWFGFHADVPTFMGLFERGASLSEWTGWLLSDAAPALVFGLFVISVVAAALGYVIAAFAWRWWTVHKRRTRLAMRAGH